MARSLAELKCVVSYPPDIRKAIDTTNAIESLSNVIRKATKNRKQFPTDDYARKVVYLAIQQATKNGLCRSESEASAESVYY